jgi:DNA polymerase-3 subunit delta'
MKPDDVLRNLKNAFKTNRLAHAYVVVGAPREEGRILAENLLGLIFCEEHKDRCGNCRSCRQVKDHTHPDILWIEPQKKSRKISIEQIRDLQGQVFRTSFQGGWKACVLVGADRVGEQAANAFLKTLEEPPAKCVFLLLTDSPQFLLPTVLSRCQTINVSSGKLNIRDTWLHRIVEILSRERNAGKVKRGAIAAFALAESVLGFLAEIEKGIEAEETETIAGEALDNDDETLEARISSRYREARSAIMRAILLWHRDVLMLVCGMDSDLTFGADSLDGLRRGSKGLGLTDALRNVSIVEEMNRQLERNIPEGPVLNLGFSRLC